MSRADGFSTIPQNVCPYYIQFQYNFATNAYMYRGVELKTSGEDTGELTGTVSSPTFNSATELRLLRWQVYASSSSTEGAVYQGWWGDDSDAWPAGALVTSNFVP